MGEPIRPGGLDRLWRMIAATQAEKEAHRAAYLAGHKARTIDAAACAIREVALRDAYRALTGEDGPRPPRVRLIGVGSYDALSP